VVVRLRALSALQLQVPTTIPGSNSIKHSAIFISTIFIVLQHLWRRILIYSNKKLRYFSSCTYNTYIIFITAEVPIINGFFFHQGDLEDNLANESCECSEGLRELAEWSDEMKEAKLSLVSDPLARNLIAQMLMKNPLQRAPLCRVLAHPFLSNKRPKRLIGTNKWCFHFIFYKFEGFFSIILEAFLFQLVLPNKRFFLCLIIVFSVIYL